MRRDARIATAALLGFSAAAGAADWDALPFGSIGGYYETNQGLSPIKADEVKVSGLAASAGVALRAVTPLSTFTVRPYGRFTYFPSEQDRDYNNAFLDLDYKRKGEKSQFNVYGEAAHEIVTSEALPSTRPQGDLGDPLDSGTVSATTRSRRDMLSLYPSFAYSIAPRQTLELSGGFSDISYNKQLPGQELGYQFSKAQLGWGFNRTQIDSITLSVNTDHFNPETVAGTSPSVGSNSYGAQLRWTRALNPKQRWYLQGGVTNTNFEEVPGVPSQGTKFGYTGGVGASWERQLSVIFFDATYGVRPSSTGAVSNQADVRLEVKRNFSERWAGSFGSRYIRSDSVNPDAVTDYRDYLAVNISTEWRWTVHLSLQGEVAFIRQKLENQPGAGESQSVSLSIAYDAGRAK